MEKVWTEMGLMGRLVVVGVEVLDGGGLLGQSGGRCVCDGWLGRARPRIRVQTNWVINERGRGAVMGPAPRPVMHAEGSRRQFVMEK